MDPFTMSCLVWFVRLALPVMFFVVWHFSQASDDKQPKAPSTPPISRAQFLARRRVTDTKATPATLAHIKVVEDTSASAGKGAGRGERSRSNADKERRDRPERKKKEVAPKVAPVVEAPTEESLKEERLHLEALLNYIAFSRKHRPQASFLPVDSGDKRLEEPAVPHEPARTNAEAQMVLKGLATDVDGLRSAELARDLLERLTEAKVEVEEQTFILMIEACIRGGDLPGISDFLQKMEAAGFCPPSNLLDKVMDLYAWQKGEVPMTMMPEMQASGPTEFIPGSPEHGVGLGSGRAVAMEGDGTWNVGAAAWVAAAESDAGAGTTFNFDAYSDEED